MILQFNSTKNCREKIFSFLPLLCARAKVGDNLEIVDLVRSGEVAEAEVLQINKNKLRPTSRRKSSKVKKISKIKRWGDGASVTRTKTI